MTYRFGRGARSAHLLRRPSGVVAGGAPPLLTTDLLFDLDARAGVTVVGGGGADDLDVTAWADQDAQSGPHDFTQGVSANRPEYDAVGSPEGGPCIQFGTAARSGAGYLTNVDISATVQAHTFYIYWNNPTAAGDSRILDATTGRILLYQTGGQVAAFDGTTTVTLGAAATGPQVLTYVWDGTTVTAYRGRASLGSGTVAGNRALNGTVFVGGTATSQIDGPGMRWLTYAGAHGAADRKTVWDHLAGEYSGAGL